MLVLGLLAEPAHGTFPGATGKVMLSGYGARVFDASNPQSTTSTAFYGGEVISNARWSPDGTRVVFQSRSAIEAANADGSGRRVLRTSGSGIYDSKPTWSPDGRSIAYGRMIDTGGPVSYEVRVMDLESGSERSVYQRVHEGATSIEWSPDGTQIAFETMAAEGSFSTVHNNLYLVGASGGTPTRIRKGPYVDQPEYPGGRRLSWSPDGRRLAYAPQDQTHVLFFARDGLADGTLQLDGADRIGAVSYAPDGVHLLVGRCTSRFGGCRTILRQLPHPTRPTPFPPDEPLERDLRIGFEDRPFSDFDVQPVVDQAAITSGPSGRTGADGARFEFTVPTEQPGEFQCRLDLKGWEPCVSPKDLDDLPDGDHLFEVRFVVEGTDPEQAEPDHRDWHVDTTPPRATITEAPTGTVTATDATVRFTSTEPDGATFQCRVDGGATFDCASPLRLASLADGPHQVAVKAFDLVGNPQSDWTTAGWEVAPRPTPPPSGGAGSGGAGEPAPAPPGPGATDGAGPTVAPPAPSTCHGEQDAKVTVGPVTAFARNGACFTESTDPQTKRKLRTTSGLVTINGVPFRPKAGSKLIVDSALGDMRVRLTGPFQVDWGRFQWDFDGPVTLPVTAAGTAAKLVLPVVDKAQSEVLGAPIVAAPTLELSPDDGGTTKVALKLALPKAFKGAPGDDGPGGLTFEFGFAASNDRGIRFVGKAQVDTAYLFGKVKVTDLALALDSGPPFAFEGTASLAFPKTDGGGEPKFTIAVGLRVGAGGGFPGLSKLSLQASQLQRPIGYGFFVQRLGGEFARCAASSPDAGGQFSANAGVSFGPKFSLAKVLEGEPVAIDGKVTLSLCGKDSLEVTGDGKVVDVPVANGSARYVFAEQKAELAGSLDLSIAGYGFLARIADSWFDAKARAFNVRAAGDVRLPGFTGGVFDGSAEVVLSSVGHAACFGPPERRIGWGKRWGGALEKFADVCDVGPFQAQASTRQAGGGSGFTVPPRARVHVVALPGAASPPKVVITGPGGRRIDTPAGPEAVATPQHIVLQDPEDRTTYVALLDPPAGRWVIEPLPGAEAPVGVRTARALAPVDLSARVQRTRRGHRLRWRLKPRAGQVVTFVERGAGTQRTLTRTTKARGVLAFTPDPARSRARRIEAVITQGGLPRATEVVARFTAPRMRRPVRVKALSLRGGSRLTWRAQAAAARYAVVLRDAARTTRAFETTRPRLTVPKAMRGRRLTASVVPVDRAGAPGPAASRTWRPARAPRRR